MKKILAVLSFCFVSVFGQDKSPNYGEKLIREDFLRYADKDKKISLEKELKSDFASIYSEEIYRFAHIDAEELAEFNFDFMKKINRILSKRNLQISVVKDQNYFQNHIITINGEEIGLYKHSEMKDFSFWEKASHRFFSKLNQILERKNIKEQFYLVYAGNDLSAFLLTQKQFQIIEKAYKKSPKDIPYLPKIR